MNRRGFGVVLGVALLFATFLPVRLLAAPQIPTQSAAQIIIRLKPHAASGRTTQTAAASGFGIAAIKRIHQQYGIANATRLVPESTLHHGHHPLADIWVVDASNTDVDQLLAAYRAVPDVIYAELDRPLTLFTVNDSLYDMQWGLHNVGQAHPAVLSVKGTGNDVQILKAGSWGADIHADPVLSNPPAGSTVVVAIIDTGVDPNHPELVNHLWTNPREIAANGADDDHNGYIDDVHGWDHSGDVFVIPPINNGDPLPTDYHGHGTHCAGIVAAQADNGRGIAGIAAQCRIMPVKIFPLALTSIAARALIYAVDNGADVVNMSWGSPWQTQVLEDAVNYAIAGGVVLCAASGNDSSATPMYPAGYPGVIAVGATDDHDHVTPFSNYGEHLCVVAPGLDILSLRAAGTDMYAPTETGVHKVGDGYYLASGTSMASPFVTGAAAQLRSVSPGLSPQRVRDLLEASASDLQDPMGDGSYLPGRDLRSGAGRLNLDSLLILAPHEAAQISWPRAFETVTGTVQITGTAQSDRALGYVLEYGLGPAPTSWTEISTGTAAMDNESLGSWHTESLDGMYTLRLRVGDSNAAFVRVYAANSRRAEITSPADDDTVTSWTDVQGSATDPSFHAYLLELSEGAASSTWTVIKHGTQPVTDGNLTTWNAGQLADGWYRFRVRLITDVGEAAADTVRFYLRSTFSSARAWKVPLGTTGSALVASYADLDADLTHEIVVATSSGIRAFRPDGQVDEVTAARLAPVGPCSLPLAIGDVDGDGKDDLVAINDSGVIWIIPSSEKARTIVTKDPPFLGNVDGIEEFLLPGIFLKDIDGDNRDEIHYFAGFTTSDARSYHVYWSNGHAPLEIKRDRFTTRTEFMDYFPADLDANGEDELYIAGDQLYRLDQSGVLLDSVALVDSTGHKAAARTCSAVDIDGDGRLELVIMAVTEGSPSNYVLFVFEDNLALKPTWPRNTGIEYFWAPSDPVFCDTDGDGYLEYFISWFDTVLGRISAWHADGTPLSGHESYSVWTSSIDPAKFRAPVATDLNADGFADLISCATEDMYLTYPVERILAWDQLGHVLSGWPVIVESGTPLAGSSRRQTTAVGDIDRNGTTDMMMVTSDNNLVFVNVPGAVYDSAAPRVEFWRYDRSLDNTVPVASQLRVQSVTPTRLQPNVTLRPTITFGFNIGLDPAQNFSGFLEVSGSATGIHSGTTNYDPLTKRLSFVTSADFADGELVTVRLSKAARPQSGIPLAQDFHTSFLVGARVPLATAPFPAAGHRDVPRNTAVSFQLTTDVDSATVTDSSLVVTGMVHGKYAGILQYDSRSRRVTFVSNTEFAPAELVTAAVQPGITSVEGIVGDTTYSWSFTIAWPQVLSTVPAAYAVGAARSTYVSATLDGPLPAFAVDDSCMYVYSSTRGRIRGSATFVPSTQSLRYSPAEPFKLGDRITAMVPSLHRSWEFAINSVGGALRFAPPKAIQTTPSPRQVIAGDVDGDGAMDLVATRWPSPFVYLLHHTPSGTFHLDSVLTGGTVGQVLLADLDADLDLDLIAADQIGHSLALLYNLGAGRFAPPEVLSTPDMLECSALDLNADGHLDLMSHAMTTSQVAVWLNAGDGTFRALPRLATPSIVTSAVPIDFNSDGRIDIAAGDLSGHITLFEGDGAGALVRDTSWSTGVRIVNLYAADCYRDSKPDLLVLHVGGKLEEWRHESDDSYLLDTIYAVSPSAERVLTADFDADGRLDLAVAGGADCKVHILSGGLDGRFSAGVEATFPDSVWSVAVADLDADGDLDLATGGERSVGVAYFGSGSSVSDEPTTIVPGQFELSQNYPNPFNPSTALEFAVPTAAYVRLDIFNILGQEVARLKNEVLAAGYYHLLWDGRSDAGSQMPSGVYFYRLQSDGVTLTRRMLLLR